MDRLEAAEWSCSDICGSRQLVSSGIEVNELHSRRYVPMLRGSWQQSRDHRSFSCREAVVVDARKRQHTLEGLRTLHQHHRVLLPLLARAGLGVLAATYAMLARRIWLGI